MSELIPPAEIEVAHFELLNWKRTAAFLFVLVLLSGYHWLGVSDRAEEFRSQLIEFVTPGLIQMCKQMGVADFQCQVLFPEIYIEMK